jgi:hypothetical protein
MHSDIENNMHHRKQKTEVVSKDDAVTTNRRSKEETSLHSRRYPSSILLAFSLSVVTALFLSYRFLSWYLFLQCWTLLPVALCGYHALHRRSLISASVVLSVLSAQLPPAVAKLLAALAVLAFSLYTKNVAADASNAKKKQRSFVTVVIAIIAMIAVLLTENFFIWVVSATFLPGQNPDTAPPPLQDNGQLMVKSLFLSISKTQVVQLRRLWNTQWALVAALGASFIQVEVLTPSRRRSLYGIGTRAVLTVAAARAIRTVSFLLTVLPSQLRTCYPQRFPLPPSDIFAWIWVGILPRTHGGCNDLIISGHAVITSTSTLSSWSLRCVICAVVSSWRLSRVFFVQWHVSPRR